MTNLSYYKVLRLPTTATPKEIQRAFIDLSILFDGSKNPIAKEIMGIISEAFSILREPDTRAKYDLEMIIAKSNDTQNIEFTEAEKIINSWQNNYTKEEQAYIYEIHLANRIIKFIAAIGILMFLWFVITLRFDIAFLIIFALFFTYRVLWSIYRIKNPSPTVELWGVE
jgi:hypothetical protein